MTTATKTKLLAFMTDAPDGKYDATKPTDAQLAAVLPWLIDTTVRWAKQSNHCDVVNAGIHNIVTNGKAWDGVYYYAANGLDCYGRNRDGRDAEGFDVDGYDAEGYGRRGFHRNTGLNREGFNRYGYDKDGFDVRGVDQYGQTREQAIAKLVNGWTKPHLDLVAATLAKRQADKAAAEAQAVADAAEAALDAAAPAEPTVVGLDEQPAQESVKEIDTLPVVAAAA